MYNSSEDTLKHIEEVRYFLRLFADALIARGNIHDLSKLNEPEKSVYDEWIPKIRQAEFGSDEYKAALAGMGEGLKHHYREYRHHPEHFENGIQDMTLVDLVEMLCDWIAASKGNPNLDVQAERYEIGDQLKAILVNTVGYLFL